MTQGMPPCGTRGALDLARTGLNLAISAMVAPRLMQESNQMIRREWMWTAAALAWSAAACGRRPPLNAFPEAVGVWRRTSVRDLPVSDAPDPVPRMSVHRLQTAVYEGPGKLEARAYELTASAVGLDLVQRWRPSADTVFFNPGRFFVVVKWQQADRQALRDFIREMEKRLTALSPAN